MWVESGSSAQLDEAGPSNRAEKALKVSQVCPPALVMDSALQSLTLLFAVKLKVFLQAKENRLGACLSSS